MNMKLKSKNMGHGCKVAEKTRPSKAEKMSVAGHDGRMGAAKAKKK